MSYRRLVSVTGIAFFPLGFLARLPYAMTPLATLILIDDNFTFAGLAGAAQSLAMAVSGPVIGVLADRVGQRAVGLATTLANIAALFGLLWLAHGSHLAIMVMAVLAGLTQPQVGPLVRVHWSHLADDELLPTALAYEAAADETSFVAGPALVGLLTPLGHGVPLLATTALLGVATLPFALRQGSPRRQVRRSRSGLLPIGPLSGMFLAMAAIGAIFGIVQTGVTAYAPNSAGLIYAEFGVGSALAGAACAWLPRRFTLRLRYLVFAGTLFVGMIALTLLPVPIGVAVAGVTVAPYMICLYSLTERLGRRDQAATIMTILCAGGPLGTAAGRAVAGLLVDLHGSAGAFLAAPGVAAAALVLAAVVVIGRSA
ncbi:MAG TPA: MFS transporter [Pseudonocardiaceae bacterium]|nr:MFS transporter [Pseudonocardiaceae bacterium]